MTRHIIALALAVAALAVGLSGCTPACANVQGVHTVCVAEF
jgi:hypothetical protein